MRLIGIAAAALAVAPAALAQTNPPQPAAELAENMAKRLGESQGFVAITKKGTKFIAVPRGKAR